MAPGKERDQPRDTISRIGNTFGRQVIEVEQSKEKGPLGLWTKSKSVKVKYLPDQGEASGSGSDDPPPYSLTAPSQSRQPGRSGAVAKPAADAGGLSSQQVLQTSLISSVVTGMTVVGLYVVKRLLDNYETTNSRGSKNSS